MTNDNSIISSVLFYGVVGLADDDRKGTGNAKSTGDAAKITLDDKTRFASSLYRLSGMVSLTTSLFIS